MKKMYNKAFGIVTIYFLIGCLWILFTDRIISNFISDIQLLTKYQTYKGWFYIFSTTVLLYFLIASHLRKTYKTNQQLEESNQLKSRLLSGFNLAQQTAEIGSWEWDILTAKVWWSDELYKIFEVDPNSYVPDIESYAAFVHPDDKIIYKKKIDDALSNKSMMNADIRIISGAGVLKYCNSIGIPIFDSEGKPVFMSGTFMDITSRKQAELALRDSETRYRSFFENSMDAILLVSPDGGIISANPAACELFGYTEDELIAIGRAGIVDNSDPDLQAFLQSEVKEMKVRGELTFIRKNGNKFFAEFASAIFVSSSGAINTSMIIRDITERRLAEEELRKSEEQHRYLFDNNPLPMWAYDINTLAFIAVNDAAIEKYKYSRDEFLNMTIADIRPHDEISRLKRDVEQPRTVIQHSGEWRHMLKDGSVIDVEITSHLLRIGDHDSALVVAQDITSRKQAESTLRKQADLLEMAHDSILIRDKDSKITYWNRGAAECYGWMNHEALGKESNILLKTNFPLPVEVINTELYEKGRWEGELLHTRKDGTQLTVSSRWQLQRGSDNSISVLEINNDITARKQAEEKLSEALNYTSNIIRNSPQAIIVTDTEGIVLLWNEAAETIFGLRPDETLGKFNPIIPAGKEPESQNVRNEILAGETITDYETERVHKNGSVINVSISASPLRNSAGKITGILAIISDISERRKAEMEIRDLNNDLELRVIERTGQLQVANNELEAFSYSVSHDLRAPLRGIDGFTRILLDDYSPQLDEEGIRICNIIRDNTRRMGQLIDDLLAFSRLGRFELNKSWIDMKTLVNDVFNEITESHSKEKIEFKVSKLSKSYSDPNLIRQVWINLLSNAVKYSSKKEKSVISVNCKTENGKCIYTVSDNGAGFDMEYYNKLFGVFQRLHSPREFEGNGVGLASVQRIVKRHGGEVWAEGKEGEGATFYFSLPVENLPDQP